MSEVIEFIKSAADLFRTFFDLMINLLTNFDEILVNALQLIVYILTYIPNMIVNTMFYNLPSVFQSGLTSLFSIFIFLFVLKLYQLIKFW